MKKTLPIGHEFYKEIIKKELYYVDKTLLVKDRKNVIIFELKKAEKFA